MIDIFVFGSNLAGRHGKGAALDAYNYYGAEYGVGEGPTGNCYAIPTKDENLKTRKLIDINENIKRFIEYARGNIDMCFHVTPIGTGLAGYDRSEIANLFYLNGPLSDNVVFTKHWFEEDWWND